MYEPNSFVPLALVRSSNANDSDAEKPEGLPAEYQTLKELHPQEWEATLNKMPRKLAATIRQLEQPAKVNNSSVEILYYHTDHLGTPRELTDNEGHIVWSATYKAWGNTAKIETPPRLVTSTDGNTLTQRWEQQDDPIEQNLRFQGQYYDHETGLHYNRFRHYDPDCGRFISQDPIGLGEDKIFTNMPVTPLVILTLLGFLIDACTEAYMQNIQQIMMPEMVGLRPQTRMQG